MSESTDNVVISRGVHVGGKRLQNEIVFVDETETAIARVCNIINDSKNDCCEIVITDKRIYVTETTKKCCHENIVDIDTVQYVDFTHSKFRTLQGLPFLIIGFMLLALGAAFGFFFDIIPLYSISGVGLVIFTMGIILSRKRNRHDLIIGSSVSPIRIVVDRFKKTEVRQIQKAIFAAIDNNKKPVTIDSTKTIGIDNSSAIGKTVDNCKTEPEKNQPIDSNPPKNTQDLDTDTLSVNLDSILEDIIEDINKNIGEDNPLS